MNPTGQAIVIDKDVIGKKDKTVQPVAEPRNTENHYYFYCNIFQMINIPGHANNNVNHDIAKLHSFFRTKKKKERESIARVLGLSLV